MPIQKKLAPKIQAEEAAFAVDIRARLAKFSALFTENEI